MIIPSGSQGSFDVYVATSDNKLFRVPWGKDRVEMGGIDGDCFVANNREERGWSININFGSFACFTLRFGPENKASGHYA